VANLTEGPYKEGRKESWFPSQIGNCESKRAREGSQTFLAPRKEFSQSYLFLGYPRESNIEVYEYACYSY
jgi:hypothetical protein